MRPPPSYRYPRRQQPPSLCRSHSRLQHPSLPPCAPPNPTAAAPPQVRRLFGSREAAKAIYACRELEYQQYEHREALQRLLQDEGDALAREDVDLATLDIATFKKEYAESLSSLKAAFPRQVCCDAFGTGGCVHGKPCECGWTQAPCPWPWILHRHGGPFCDCHMESRAAWMEPARVKYWHYLSKEVDLGHHLYPKAGPQRENGA